VIGVWLWLKTHWKKVVGLLALGASAVLGSKLKEGQQAKKELIAVQKQRQKEAEVREKHKEIDEATSAKNAEITDANASKHLNGLFNGGSPDDAS
jgi:galactose-1-phosphate uridylyltransferase